MSDERPADGERLEGGGIYAPPVGRSRPDGAPVDAVAGRHDAGSASPFDGTGAAPPPPPAAPETHDRAGELLTAFWFVLSAVGAVFFFVFYWIHAGPTTDFDNGAYGLSLAVALFGLGLGAITWAKRVMPEEHAVQEREPFGSPPEDVAQASHTFTEAVAGTQIARRPLIRRTLLLAGGTLLLPVIAPLRSLGPKPVGRLNHTQWTAGARMVLSDGTPIRISDLDYNGIALVLPEGHTDIDSAADSAVNVIRLPPDEITPKLAAKAYQGFVAFSRICTHAGCPVALYDQQTHVLLCPCHQSQFKILQGAKPVAGPATRSLPQLAITADSNGYLRAVRDFDEAVGPGFWERRP